MTAKGESMAVLFMKAILQPFSINPYLASFIFMSALAWTFVYMRSERLAQQNLRNILGIILLGAALFILVKV